MKTEGISGKCIHCKAGFTSEIAYEVDAKERYKEAFRCPACLGLMRLKSVKDGKALFIK